MEIYIEKAFCRPFEIDICKHDDVIQHAICKMWRDGSAIVSDMFDSNIRFVGPAMRLHSTIDYLQNILNTMTPIYYYIIIILR